MNIKGNLTNIFGVPLKILKLFAFQINLRCAEDVLLDVVTRLLLINFVKDLLDVKFHLERYFEIIFYIFSTFLSAYKIILDVNSTLKEYFEVISM